MTPTWTVSQKIAAGVTLALVIVAATGVVAFRSVGALLESIDWRVHTQKVLREIEEIDLALVEAETTQRGFVIAGTDEYLAPFQTALAEIERHTAAFERLTADNASQQQRLAALRPKIAAKLEFMRGNIERRRASGLEATAKETGEQREFTGRRSESFRGCVGRWDIDSGMG